MRVQIRLPERAWEQLSDLAYRERRHPKQQAEYLILRALGVELPFGEDAPQGAQEREITAKQQIQEGKTSWTQTKPPVLGEQHTAAGTELMRLDTLILAQAVPLRKNHAPSILPLAM
jgi:hypothetical protein